MKERIKTLRTVIGEILWLFNSPSSWDLKYSLIFTQFNEAVCPAMAALGLSLNYVDPDLDCEQDVTALVDALKLLLADLPDPDV